MSSDSRLHPEMERVVSRLSAPQRMRSNSDSRLVRKESIAIVRAPGCLGGHVFAETASKLLADALHHFSSDLQKAAGLEPDKDGGERGCEGGEGLAGGAFRASSKGIEP